MYNLHSVVYESRDYSANHPCAAQRTDNQQYDNGGSHSRHIVGNGYFVISPGNPVEATPIKTQTAVVVSRDIWLPPLKASLPKVRMVANSIPIKRTMGRKDTRGEGIFFCCTHAIILL